MSAGGDEDILLIFKYINMYMYITTEDMPKILKMALMSSKILWKIKTGLFEKKETLKE